MSTPTHPTKPTPATTMAEVLSTVKTSQPAAPSNASSKANRIGTAATSFSSPSSRNTPNSKAPVATPRVGSFSTSHKTNMQGSSKTTPLQVDSLPETTDSEDGASDWAEGRANINPSESELEFCDSGRETAAQAKGNLAKKTLKRPRAGSDASTAAKAPKKRVRTTPLQRQAPIMTNESPLPNGEMAHFATTIFVIQLAGPDGRRFTAHEGVLKRSPKFREEIAKAKANKRATKHNFLPLMAHDPVAFDHLIKYLYTDNVILSNKKETAKERCAEILELMSLSKHYVLPGMQQKIVKIFSRSKMPLKVTTFQFFDWAYDMYYEEIDHENGPFKTYFARVAPAMMAHLKPDVMKELCRYVKLGKGFAEEIFKASIQALGSVTPIKQEKVEEEEMDTGDGEA